MDKKPTTAQAHILLATFAAGPIDGWHPDGVRKRAELAASARLCTRGLLAKTLRDTSPRYVLTADGRVALGIDTSSPAPSISEAVERGIAWLGFPEGDCEFVLGPDLQDVDLGEGAPDLSACRFALLQSIDGGPFACGPLRALFNELVAAELVWASLARYVTELGFPTRAGRDEYGHVTFWPDDKG